MSTEKERGAHRGGIVIEIDSRKEFITQREIDILQLRVNGLNLIETASNLHVSEETVRKHSSSLFNKLDVESLTEAIVVSAEKQIINVINAVAGLDINKVRNLTPIQQEIIEKVISNKGSREKAKLALFMSKGSLAAYVFKINKTLGLTNDEDNEHRNKFHRAVLLYMEAKRQGIIKLAS